MGLKQPQEIVQAVIQARSDLARRLGAPENEILEGAVEEVEFPDAALGAPVADEMSAQVITPGWRIRLTTRNKTYEYRAAGGRLRLYQFDGENYKL
jgi:hypothetical protein